MGHLRFRWLPVHHAELVLPVGLLHCGCHDRVWRGSRAREGSHLRVLRIRDDQLLGLPFFLRSVSVCAYSHIGNCSGFIYPVVVAWTWGGGWLYDLWGVGVMDFAGVAQECLPKTPARILTLQLLPERRIEASSRMLFNWRKGGFHRCVHCQAAVWCTSLAVWLALQGLSSWDRARAVS